MKLLLLGVIAIVLLAVASGGACFRDSDGFWRWRDEVRERAFEAREAAREARQAAREQAQEFRDAQREAWRARRDAARERRDRMREEIRDWRYTY
jgi:biopolymer transport protein ExbB/TolQ